MNEVNLKYIGNCLESEDNIIKRCKEIAELIMYQHSDNHIHGPFGRRWEEENITYDGNYIHLSLVCFGSYGDCDDEEDYYIPVAYFDMSEEEIVADIKEKDAKDKERQYQKDLEDLRRTAVRLGCRVEELPK